MLELDDSALLKEYVEHGSEEAFATLVARHVNKVYSIALRHTRNAHQAEEITQAVFVILAKKSRQLGKRVILSGSTRIMPNRCCMQVAEVWLTTSAPPNQVGSPAAAGLNR